MSTLVAVFFVSFCLGAPASAATVTAAAAADVSAAGNDLSDGFHRTYPQDTVRFAFGASGSLARQIANGAPYDLFLSANAAFVDQLAAAGKTVPGSNLVYAYGEVGILWHDGKPHNFSDLAGTAVRFVAIANPKLAPYGAAAEQALEHEGLWDTIRSKLVFGENVRQALQLFDSGNADVVLTSYSLLVGRQGAAIVPGDWHKPIRQKVGVVVASANREAAQRFLAFLVSPAGKRILEAHGLRPAE